MTRVKAACDVGHRGSDALRGLDLEAHQQVPAQQPVLLVNRQERVKPTSNSFSELAHLGLDPPDNQLLKSSRSLVPRAAISPPNKNRAMRVSRVIGQS